MERSAVRRLRSTPPTNIRRPAPNDCAQGIETRIDDDFDGWEGETLFKLANGQIWIQVEYGYEYHYAYRPEVVIYPSSGGCKMRVEGMGSAIGVERLR